MKKIFRRRKPSRPLTLRTPDEIAILREAGRLVAQTFAAIEPAVKPGALLSEVDRIATEYLLDHNAQTLYKGYRGSPPTQPPFPGVICASINEEICHGIPNERELHDGDIVGIDIGLVYEGYCGDACITFAVGEVAPATARLLAVAREGLNRGIGAAQPGAHLSDIGAAIQSYVEGEGFSVVREWGGHSIGQKLHEGLTVAHVGPAGHGPLLEPGMVFTIEPMINAGDGAWGMLSDGWTVVTKDGSLSAQFEHTIAIMDDGPMILSKL